MEKVLTQAEIDALVRAARSGGEVASQPAAPVQVEPWDVRRAGQIGREQLQAITFLHEGFARNLTHSLGAYLRVRFAATLVSAEHLTYRDYLQLIPETTYMASCRLDPMGAHAALELDLKVAFPIIDLLLGGEGKGTVADREITEIEAQILDGVTRIVCRELGVAWQALAISFNFEERLKAGEAQRLMPPEEKTLSLTFEISVQEVRAGLNLAIPSSISTALLRKISADWRPRPSAVMPHARERLRERLLDCPFEAELGAGDMRVAVRQLAELAPGQVVAFARCPNQPATLRIAGLEAFRAVPARCGTSRAAKILERSPSETGNQEADNQEYRGR